jgi:hypothetical protein
MNDTYTEVTVWHGGDSPEIMVHVTPDNRVIRAYVYKSDLPFVNKNWIGKPCRNPLFVDLNDKALASKGLRRSAIAQLKRDEKENKNN